MMKWKGNREKEMKQIDDQVRGDIIEQKWKRRESGGHLHPFHAIILTPNHALDIRLFGLGVDTLRWKI